MDYAIDFYIRNDNDVPDTRGVYSNFIYDDRRICSKLYVFFKLMGLIIYTTTLTTCYIPDFFVIMIVVMFLSAMNSMRYEYKHLMRYGTNFSSIDEFDTWKREQWPKTRIFFLITELAIKVAFFIKIFPPQFEFKNRCDIGESIFKIHILVLFAIYIIYVIFSICILSTVCCHNYSYPQPVIRQVGNISSPVPTLLINSVNLNLNLNLNEECCICLDVNNIKTWSILPCGHKFHSSCVSTWLHNHQTCPICRCDIINVP